MKNLFTVLAFITVVFSFTSCTDGYAEDLEKSRSSNESRSAAKREHQEAAPLEATTETFEIGYTPDGEHHYKVHRIETATQVILMDSVVKHVQTRTMTHRTIFRNPVKAK